MSDRDSLSGRLRALVRHRFVQDTMVLQAGQAVAIGAQAVTSLVLLRVLGPELVGLYALSVAMVAALSLFDLTGSNRVALVEIARALGSGSTGELRDALAGSLRVNLQITGALVVAFLALAPWISQLAYGRSDVGFWARGLAVPLVLDVPFNLLLVVLQGRRRMRRLVGTESARAIATSAASLVALLAGWGVTGLVAVRVAASGVASAWAVVAYGALARRDRDLPGWAELVQRVRRVPLAWRLRFGLSMAIDKKLGDFGGQLPVLMMGALDPAGLGYFSAALRVVSMPYPLVSALARNLDAVLPFRAGQSLDAVRRAFLRTTFWAGALWMLVTLAMAFAAPVALVWLGGPDYAPAVPVVYPLLLQSVAVGFGVGIGATLRALDRLGYGIAMQLTSILLSLPLGYVLIVRLGAPGGAWLHALRYTFITVVGVSMALWLVRTGRRR